MKKVLNPTEQTVKLNYKGSDYFIEAKVKQSFPDDVAEHWVRMFEFMTLETMTDEDVIVTKEEVPEKKVAPKKK